MRLGQSDCDSYLDWGINSKWNLVLILYNNCFANSVDPDEMACNEPSHQDLHCLPFCFEFCLWPLFGAIVLTWFKDERVHCWNSEMKELNCNIHFSLNILVAKACKCTFLEPFCKTRTAQLCFYILITEKKKKQKKKLLPIQYSVTLVQWKKDIFTILKTCDDTLFHFIFNA